MTEELTQLESRRYWSVKERDGSHTIRQSSPPDIVCSARGCNVDRMLDKLRADTYYRTLKLRGVK